MQSSKGPWSSMASHLIKKLTFIFVAFSFMNLALAELEASARAFYKQGDEFALKAYKEYPSVYVHIDAVFDHPYLDKYYLISFYGVCMNGQNMSKIISASQALDQIPISHEALTSSVSKIKINKKLSMKCDDRNFTELEWFIGAINRGNYSVLLSPLDSTLSMSVLPQIPTIIHN
mgnify:CR=1 FL=1